MFRQILRQILGYLPKRHRHAFYRRQLTLPWNPPEDVQFKLISSADEMIQSTAILHHAYVEKGYMDPDPLGLRLTPYHLSPSTCTAIAVKGDRVIATMSVVRDNSIGIPMDKIFDLSPLRKRGEVLCEVSALAIHPEFRKSGGHLLHSLIRYLWRYCYESFGIDRYVIAVNPAMVELYEAIYLFDLLPVKMIESYDFVKGAPAVALSLEVKSSYDRIRQVYKNVPLEGNLYQFMQVSHHQVERYSHSPFYNFTRNFFPPTEWLSLRKKVPDLNLRFPEKIALALAKQWGHEKLEDIGALNLHRQRYQMHKMFPHQNQILQLIDVSKYGFCISAPPMELATQQGPERFVIPLGPGLHCAVLATPVWRSPSGHMGFLIQDADPLWFQMIQYFEKGDEPQTLQTSTYSRAS